MLFTSQIVQTLSWILAAKCIAQEPPPLILPPCPFLLGPDFVAPSSPSKSEPVQNAIKAIDSAVKAAIKNQQTKFGYMNTTATSFSVNVYSTRERGSLYDFHYSAPGLSKPKQGVSKVDGDTIYRIGSVSKLLTVYMYLASAGDLSFNDPITKYVPEFAEYAAQHKVSDANLYTWDYESITIQSLAAQLSGLPRDAAGVLGADDLLRQLPREPKTPANLTGANCPKSYDDTYNVPCTRAAFLQNLMYQKPSVPPWQGPTYSNSGFGLLALALERITKKSLQELFQTYLVEPLDLKGTSYDAPPTNRHAIIPFSNKEAGWTANITLEAGAGNFYSSTNDMQKIGRSILDSTMMSPAMTRRWLKPVTFGISITQPVGAPWEIFSFPRNVGHPGWIYTKAGDIGLYSTFMGLIPDYDVGFSVFAAGRDPGSAPVIVSNIITSILTPALEQAAKDQAHDDLAGTYRDAKTNSTVVLTTDKYQGLAMTKWIVNGTDMSSVYHSLVGFKDVSFRLFPNGLKAKGGSEVGYQLGTYPADMRYEPGPIVAKNCYGWFFVDPVVYGGLPLDEFIVHMDDTGRRAVAVEPRAFRVPLPRVS